MRGDANRTARSVKLPAAGLVEELFTVNGARAFQPAAMCDNQMRSFEIKSA
jgi:hypothetical protein